MAGQYSGLASRNHEVHPLDLYTHCASHRLNLCVATACLTQSIQNMMSILTKVGTFFHIPKRQQLLQRIIKKSCNSRAHINYL